MMTISSRKPRIDGDARAAAQGGSIMKFRLSDWLAAVAVVVALGAFAAAETVDEAPTTIAAR
jgi:hypothetical protein